MDENLDFDGKEFHYHIKTYHCYLGKFRIKKGTIKVTIKNYFKNQLIRKEKFSSKALGEMSMEQKREYILDCLYIFDKRIKEFNEGKKLLG